MDQLRSTLAQLPEQTRAHATEKAIRALDQLRQNLTES
jgi:hypothetical protein